MGKLFWLIGALALLGGPAAAGRWDMPTPYADNNFHTVNIKQFAAEVNEATGGRLEIVVHSAASLFKLPEIKRAVQTGQVPIGEVLMSALGNEDPMFEVDSVPFLAANYESARRLWQISKPYVDKRLAKQGIVPLFAVPWPPQALFARKELNSVADLKGVKFRVYNPATSRLAELMGALPTTVQMPELAQAFSTGMVHAMITSPTFAVDTQGWDFVEYMYQARAMVPKDIVLVNQRALRRLDGDLRTALLEAAARAEARGWEMSANETQVKTRILEEKGMKVREVSAGFRDELVRIGATMTEEWVAKAGVDGRAVVDAFKAR